MKKEKRKIKYKLKGHETFAIREGWLSKGMRAVVKDSRVFFHMYGADALGVGANMAKAIRYWLKATGLTVEKSGQGAVLSEFGKMVYEYDPYLEEDFTLWCIHINLVENRELATTWYLFFQCCEAEEFTKEELERLLAEELIRYSGEAGFSRRSLADDCNVLLQMYGREKIEENDPEDKKICPLTKIGILRKSENAYKRTQPDLNRFPETVMLYLLQGIWKERDCISMEELYQRPDGVRHILGLGPNAYQEYLERFSSCGYCDLNRTAGLDMIYKKTYQSREQTAENYYKER